MYKSSLRFLAVLAVVFFSFQDGKPKSTKKPPKGMVAVHPQLFMAQTETSVAEYLIFYNQIATDSGLVVAAKYYPDTATVGIELGIDPSQYFNGNAFRLHPVMGVSYEQAVAYCNWKTNLYNNLQTTKLNDKMAKKLFFRLPTREEWMVCAEANTGNNLFWWGENYTDNKTRPLLQAYYDPNDGIVKDYSLTAPVKYFKPNPFGLYNMHGNVAEMTWVKGIAIGGSYRHQPTECVVVSKQTYTQPTAWLGFRVVAQIIEP